ncbi:helix-turn-helix domain protein [Actinobacteria bacterium OK074]|nr:helix-turn-helix domain protein [Actinobacteria bacterium OK074]
MVNRKELHPESSPRAAYGARLRRLREKRGWTQDDVADQLSYSSQHMSAIETAYKPPTLIFSRKIDVIFGLVGTDDSFETEWHAMRQRSLLEGFPEYVVYEAKAAELRLFMLGIIPGLLQTPAYANAVAAEDVRRGTVTPEQAEERVSFLAERQAALVRPRPPTIIAVMDESCIRRPVGGPEVMDAQLARLIEFAELPNTVLQIVPFSVGERRPFDLPLNILTMPDRSLMAYAESALRGHLERESSFVVPLLASYHQLQAEALSQAASVAMIEQARKGTP